MIIHKGYQAIGEIPMRDDPPTAQEVMADPHLGDVLVFDGKQWRVSRRDGWNYLVEAPKESPK